MARPKGYATLKLLRDVLGNQGRVNFRLADFDDVQRHLGLGHLRQVLAQNLDVLTLLADDNAGTGGINRDPRLLRRTLDDYARHAGTGQFLAQMRTQLEVFVQQLGVIGASEPTRVPGAIDAEPKPDRIDFMTHQAALFSVSGAGARSATTIFRWLNHFSTRAARPRPRAWKRRITIERPTSARTTTS